jgi:hypothetical protein
MYRIIQDFIFDKTFLNPVIYLFYLSNKEYDRRKSPPVGGLIPRLLPTPHKSGRKARQ